MPVGGMLKYIYKIVNGHGVMNSPLNLPALMASHTSILFCGECSDWTGLAHCQQWADSLMTHDPKCALPSHSKLVLQSSLGMILSMYLELMV